MLISRRDLLDRMALGLQLLPALAFAPRSCLSQLLFAPDSETVSAKPVPVNPFRRDGRARVVLVHGSDPEAMAQRGMALLGGMEPLGLAGRRVLIKPNVVNDRPPPTTTSPVVLAAAIAMVKRAGAAEVIVADSSGVIRFPTTANLKATGVQATAESLGARVLALEDEPWVGVEPEGAEHVGRFHVSKPVYEADVFLNLPVVKTHRFAHYSCCLKNLVGIVHPRNRPSVAVLAGSWHERIAELNLAVHPHLNIADATTVMIAGGPTSGIAARANLLLLSGDRIALDAVAVALIRTYAAWPKVAGGSIWQQRQIARAVDLRLGVTGPEQIELNAVTVDGDEQAVEGLAARLRQDLDGKSERTGRSGGRTA